MDLIFDRIINLDPVIDPGTVKQKGSSRFELELDGKKLEIEVFD